MDGYRGEDREIEKPAYSEVNTFSFVTLAPVLIGVFLLVVGLGKGWYALTALGVLLLLASPVIIRAAWRQL